MSADQRVEALASTVWVRPRDRKSKVVETWKGRGEHGEGKEEEEDPGRLLQLEETDLCVWNAFDGLLELVDAFWGQGVDLGEEASSLPAPRRRRRPCGQV